MADCRSFIFFFYYKNNDCYFRGNSFFLCLLNVAYIVGIGIGLPNRKILLNGASRLKYGIEYRQ